MRNHFPKPLLAAALFALAPLAGAEAYAPEVSATAAAAEGSAQRRAILDALRPGVVEAMRGPVEFVVERLEVKDGWALVLAQPQRPGGGRIDPASVLPADQLEFTDGLRIDALLRFKGGKWVSEDFKVGATDVWYVCYPGAPKALTGCGD